MDRPLVARATSSDDSPTPGYLYGEIAQMTHANFEGCRQLTAYLLERIKKPNHNIKFKCLHIIKVRCRAPGRALLLGCLAWAVCFHVGGYSVVFRSRNVSCGVIASFFHAIVESLLYQCGAALLGLAAATRVPTLHAATETTGTKP